MTTYQLSQNILWYPPGGPSPSKDVDGVMVINSADPDEGGAYYGASQRCKWHRYLGTRPFFWNGSTAAQSDQDGMLIPGPDTSDIEQFVGVSIPREPPPLVRGYRHVPNWVGPGSVGKDYDGEMVVGESEGEEYTAVYRKGRKICLKKSVLWMDPDDPGQTLLNDIDGIMILDAEMLPDFKELPGTYPLDKRVGAAARVEGTSTTSANALLRKLISAIIQGTSIATASPRLRFVLSEAISGTSVATAEAMRIAVTTANAAIVFSAVANSFLAITAPLPSVSRSFSERLDELRPLEGYEVGFRSNPAVNNRVELLGSANFQLVSSYTGPAYTLGGPADPGASPVQLGLKRGDKIRLIGQVGGEPNDGKEYTFFDPSTWAILESAVTPDTNEYDFIILRRIS